MDDERVFKAMADATRRSLVQLVARCELSVGELVHCLGLPQSTVSRHLKVLRDASLIHDRREGLTVLYAAPSPGSNGDERAYGLHSRILEWVAEQELPGLLDRRLKGVLEDRKRESTGFFERIGHRWDQMRIEAFGGSFHIEAMLSLLPADWCVADIGTGTGYALPLLAGMFKKVIAVDSVPKMIDLARARCRDQGIGNVTFRHGDLSSVPIRNEQVDLALAVLVLHHVPDPKRAIGELFRIVKPGGRMLIVEQRTHRLEVFHERMHDRWWGFEPGDPERDVAAAGFTTVRCNGLTTAAPARGDTEAPELFALVAHRGGVNESSKGIQEPVMHTEERT